MGTPWIFLKLHDPFFANERQTIIQVLQEEFCGKISDLLVIPSCGVACNVQENNIVFEDAGSGSSVFVNFEIVVNPEYWGIFQHYDSEIEVLA